MKGDALASCLGMDADDDDVPVAMLLQKAAEADDETGSGESKEDGNTSLTCSDEPEEETPKRAKRSNGMAKPYIQQANHTQHDTQRKLEVGANKIPCPNLHLLLTTRPTTDVDSHVFTCRVPGGAESRGTYP